MRETSSCERLQHIFLRQLCKDIAIPISRKVQTPIPSEHFYSMQLDPTSVKSDRVRKYLIDVRPQICSCKRSILVLNGTFTARTLMQWTKSAQRSLFLDLIYISTQKTEGGT